MCVNSYTYIAINGKKSSCIHELARNKGGICVKVLRKEIEENI